MCTIDYTVIIIIANLLYCFYAISTCICNYYNVCQRLGGLPELERHVQTWLVVKQEYLALAQRIFDGTGIQITSAGQPYLGAPIGSQDFITDYTQNHISQWVQSLSQLSSIAATQPHAAYAVLVHGLSSKWNYYDYYLRTNPNISDQLSPLEFTICQKFFTHRDSPSSQ